MTTCDKDEPPFIHVRAKYRVVMIRHGQSGANVKDVLGGWCDFDLTLEGVKQAKRAGITLKKRGYKFDVGHTSFLRRALRTLDIVLDELGLSSIEKYATRRLDESHPEPLHYRSPVQGSSGCGTLLVEYSDLERITDKDSARYQQDPTPVNFPSSECMASTIERVTLYWEKVVAPQMKEGKRILIVAHAGIFRALMYLLEAETLPPRRKTPNAAPFVYEFDENMKPVASRYFVAPTD